MSAVNEFFDSAEERRAAHERSIDLEMDLFRYGGAAGLAAEKDSEAI